MDVRRYNTRLIIGIDNILRVNHNGTWKQFAAIPPLRSFEILDDGIIGITLDNDLIRARCIDNNLKLDEAFNINLKVVEIAVVDIKNRSPLSFFSGSALILLEVNGDVRYATLVNDGLIIDDQVIASDVSHIYPLNLYLRCQPNICLLIGHDKRVRTIDVNSNYDVIQHLFEMETIDNVVAVRDRMVITQNGNVMENSEVQRDGVAYQFKMKMDGCSCNSSQLVTERVRVPFSVKDCILIDYMKFGEDDNDVIILLDDEGDVWSHSTCGIDGTSGVVRVELGNRKFKRILYVEDQQNPTLEDVDGHLFYLADYQQGELIKIDIPMVN